MLLLDAENKTPLYLQLYQQLRSQILHGTLSPDSRLPTTRALAEEQGIGRNTVIRAYQQLELEGYV